MRKTVVVVMAVVVGCGGDGNKSVDAPVVHDAAGDATHDAAPDAAAWQPSGMSMSHVMFLQTEGVTVTPGTTDATMDKSSLPTTVVTLKPWRMGDASRTTEIAALATEISGIVAPYNITVVTTRPATGTYHEVIITDDGPTAVGLQNGTFAVTGAGAMCNSEASPVSFAFPSQFGSAYTQATGDFIASVTISMFGLQGGVPLSTKAGDCMCFASSSCGAGSGACTIGSGGTPVDPTGNCGDHDATMNEAAVFLAVFGAH